MAWFEALKSMCPWEWLLSSTKCCYLYILTKISNYFYQLTYFQVTMVKYSDKTNPLRERSVYFISILHAPVHHMGSPRSSNLRLLETDITFTIKSKEKNKLMNKWMPLSSPTPFFPYPGHKCVCGGGGVLLPIVRWVKNYQQKVICRYTHRPM